MSPPPNVQHRVLLTVASVNDNRQSDAPILMRSTSDPRPGAVILGVGETLLSLTASCTWKDQGWGNRKGQMLLRLCDELGQVKREFDMFGIAPHNESPAMFELTSPDDLAVVQPGDTVDVYYRVGGGGGHSLSVRNFKLAISTMSEEQAERQEEEAHRMEQAGTIAYSIIGNAGARVRNGPDLDSPVVGDLATGTVVEVTRVPPPEQAGHPLVRSGRRVRVLAPLVGWVSRTAGNGTPILHAHSWDAVAHEQARRQAAEAEAEAEAEAKRAEERAWKAVLQSAGRGENAAAAAAPPARGISRVANQRTLEIPRNPWAEAVLQTAGRGEHAAAAAAAPPARRAAAAAAPPARRAAAAAAPPAQANQRALLTVASVNDHRQEDEPRLMARTPGAVLSDGEALRSLTASCTWHDQGWGNRKGQMLLRVCDRRGRARREFDLFGIAPHSESHAVFELTSPEDLGAIQPGDTAAVYYRVGGGGGHSLSVRNFMLTVSTIGKEVPRARMPREEEAHRNATAAYVVVGSGGARVRTGPGLDAPAVGELATGTVVEVATPPPEQAGHPLVRSGRRVRVLAPVAGWASRTTGDGTPILRAHSRAAVLHEEATAEARREAEEEAQRAEERRRREEEQAKRQRFREEVAQKMAAERGERTTAAAADGGPPSCLGDAGRLLLQKGVSGEAPPPAAAAAGGNGAAAPPPPPLLVPECGLCLRARKNAVFVPCGHVCCCAGCARGVAEAGGACPVCERPVQGAHKLFLA